MILKSQSISKRFGVLVIGLINKIRNHLYTYILFATIVAGILSATTWLILYRTSEKIAIMNYNKRAEEIAKELITIIEGKNLTYYQAIETIDFSQYYEENVHIESNNEKNNSDYHKRINSTSKDIVYIYPIKYSGESGTILIKPMIGMLVPNYYEFIITLISAFAFMSILFLFVKKSIRYIEEIDRSIDIISGGKLTYKIPVRGTNELSRLAANINEMSALLKERMDVEKKTDLKQRQLITNISHDLRTPLTVLIGYFDLLKNHNYETQEEADDFIYCAFQKCNQLQKLIEELFIYNKLINGDVPICLENANIVEFAQNNIEQQGLMINLESKEKEVIVSIDRKLMNRVLDNLFDNIRKYAINTEPSTVYIKKINDNIIIIVENSTNQDLSGKVTNLFERMYIGNESRANNSSGLGLSIVAEIVHLMNGTISAKFEKTVLQIIIEFN